MTVGDLIEELRKWSSTAVIVIDDADTGWELPKIKVGYGQHGQQRDLKTNELDRKVHIWANYHDE